MVLLKNLLFLIAVSFAITSCNSTRTALFDQYSYEKTIELKVETDQLINKANTTYTTNKDEIEKYLLDKEENRKKEIKAEESAALLKAETAAKQTNLSKFLVNVEARIYAQLSKQLADQMFTDSGATSGTMDFQGTNISWVKTGTDVTLTIIEANGSRTEITVPIASFAF